MKAIRKTLRSTPKWAVVHLPIVAAVLFAGVVTQDSLRELFDGGSRLDGSETAQNQPIGDQLDSVYLEAPIALAATPDGGQSTATSSDLPLCTLSEAVAHDVVVFGNETKRFALDVGYSNLDLNAAVNGRARVRSAQDITLSEPSVVSSRANVGLENTTSNWFPYKRAEAHSWVEAASQGSLSPEIQDRVLVVKSGTTLTDSVPAGSIVVLAGPGSLLLESNSGLVKYFVAAPDADLTVGESVFAVSGTIVVGSIVHHGEGLASLSVAPRTENNLSFCRPQ